MKEVCQICVWKGMSICSELLYVMMKDILENGFMIFYYKIHLKKAIILSLLFQALLLSVDYFTLWLNVSLFHSVAEINESHFVGGSLMTVLAKIILFLVVLLIRKK